MKKSDLKRRINELQSELQESIWYQAQEKGAHNVTQSALESYQEEVTDLQSEVDGQELMMRSQAATIVRLMKKLDKLMEKCDEKE